MALVYCGIDEAGYGPMLGPLCVGFAAFRVVGWAEGEPAPDLWAALSAGVCREPGDKRGRVAVADSKRLKLSNQSKTRHPLTHLERGVLAFGGVAEDAPRDDAALFAALGTRLEDRPWYRGEAAPLPVSCSAESLAFARNAVALACASGAIEPIALACIAVGEGEFNEEIRRGGSKAGVTAAVFARYLRRVVDRWADGPDSVRVVCDRHCGRRSYAGMIRAAAPGRAVETLEESERCSRYSVGGERFVVQFRPEAEDAHLPVALASMTAKFIRELAMARFNRYWCARVPELKPTAGYVQDARRWLDDLNGVLTESERESLVRTA